MPKLVPVSLADLADAGVRLRPTDAVTIVRALILQVANGILPGVPSAHVIRLAPTGGIMVEGPVVASGRPVPRAAQLLRALLRGPGRPTAEPTPLRNVIAEAIKEPSGFATLPELAEALGPFAAQDPSAAIKELISRWVESERALDPDSSELDESSSDDADSDEQSGISVSDVRRARRDTGLSLDEVSKRSRIPVSMLRQLEWGYLRNWPNGLYGRTQLVRYARAAGLDRQLVLDAMLPLVRHSQAHDESARPEVAPPVDVTGEIPAAAPPAIIVIDPNAAEEQLVDEDQPVGRNDQFVARNDQTDQPVARNDQPSARVVAPIVPSRPAAAIKPANLAASAPQPAPPNTPDRVLVGRWMEETAAFDPPLSHSATPTLLERNNTESPRRASMIAAAAALALATGAIGWAVHSQWNGDDRGPARIVRHLPAREEVVARAAREAAPPLNQPMRRSAIAPTVLPVSRPVSTSGAGAGTDARLIPVDAIDDDNAAFTAMGAAGGAAFADPVQSAVGTADPESGLGLRITRVVDDHSQNYHTRPSPDGTRVAFDSDRDGERGIFVANADGRNLRRVSGQGFAAAPNWSPDGKTLSYVRAEADNPSVWNLWALDLDSGESHRLTSNPSGRPLGGSWFPDGHRIAYSSGSSIIVLDAASGKPAVYPSPQPGRKAGSPAVSPDGRWVIFQLSGDGAWLLDLSDGSSQKVLSDPALGEFTWSPDGSRVAYYNRREGEWSVWVMAAR